MVTEYTGQLINGPDNGNLVTSSVAEIETKDILELKLDGPDKGVIKYVTKGWYIWSETENCFYWKVHDTEVFETKMI